MRAGRFPHVTIGAFLWLDLVAAVTLAVWVLVRFPAVGPRTLGWAILAFVAGQCAPSLGLAVLGPVVRLPHGSQLALVLVVLPVFFVMFVTIAWLMRACLGTIGGGGGGHRARRHIARSRA